MIAGHDPETDGGHIVCRSRAWRRHDVSGTATSLTRSVRTGWANCAELEKRPVRAQSRIRSFHLGEHCVPRKRTEEAVAHETATKMAEGIGEALARVVNRLESLDSERERAYKQLLGLQEHFNAQVARFGRALGRTVTTVSAGRPRVRGQHSKKPRGLAAKSRSRAPRKSPTKQSGKKRRIKCGVCGTSGHNARGHAKWKAAANG